MELHHGPSGNVVSRGHRRARRGIAILTCCAAAIAASECTTIEGETSPILDLALDAVGTALGNLIEAAVLTAFL